ncbi:hypothetical protein C0J52_26579 [Blattella germanica]|nr:hypothetical protein C0J52_26579 [Blattella germanica]
MYRLRTLNFENNWRNEMANDDMALWFRAPNESEANANYFHCNRCGKQYLRKITLTRHMRYDCGIEPRFSCFMCGLKVRRRYKLTSHLVAVHGIQKDEAENIVPPVLGRDKEVEYQ